MSRTALLSLRTLSIAQPEPALTQRRRVLVVEDDEAMRDWVHQMLTEDGFEAITAPEVLTAMMTLLSEDVDVVVTDYRMPGLDGFDLLQSVSRLSPGTPVIFVTAYADPILRERIDRHGAFSLLEKPFGRDALLRQVRQAVGSDRAGA